VGPKGEPSTVPGPTGEKGEPDNNALLQTYATWGGGAGDEYTFNSSDTHFTSNVSNIIRHSLGNFEIFFEEDYPDTNYHVQVYASVQAVQNDTPTSNIYWGVVYAKNTSSIRVRFQRFITTSSGAWITDTEYMNVMCVGEPQ
jgi:hypothetical protein